MAKKILILSLSAGAGHIRAAKSLEEEVELSFPQIVIEHHDLIEFVSKPLKLVYRDFYIFLSKNAPLIWGYLYKKTNSAAIHEKLQLTSPLQSLLVPKLSLFIQKFKPEVIICTHFICAEILMPILRENHLKIPVSIVITDYQIHHLWMVDGVKQYFVATDNMKKNLIEAGVIAQNITVSGIPISPAIISATRAPHLYERFNLSPKNPIILILSGGTGLLDISQLVEILTHSKLPIQICAIAGDNKELKQKLQKISAPDHITLNIYDFVHQIHDLYALSDLVISKAGGLTITECMARGLPLIITKSLPGQEEANTVFLKSNKAALYAKNANDLLSKTHRILTNKSLRNQLTKNMRAIAKPAAANTILKYTI